MRRVGRRELRQWLERPRIEPLKDGVRVVVAGPPNAGKSSLINAIAGQERAIVTDVPGTTRDHIEVPLALAGVPILLTDTAGLRETDDEVEAIGVARAEALVEAADVLLWLGEPAEAPEHPRRMHVSHARRSARPRARRRDRSRSPSVTGEGIAALARARSCDWPRSLLPAEGAMALNRRQAAHLAEAAQRSSTLRQLATELVLIAEDLRSARAAFDRLTGRAGVEDVLDALVRPLLPRQVSVSRETLQRRDVSPIR